MEPGGADKVIECLRACSEKTPVFRILSLRAELTSGEKAGTPKTSVLVQRPHMGNLINQPSGGQAPGRTNWRRLLTVPWTAKRSNQLVPKEINPEYSLEGLRLKLKLQSFGHLMKRADSLEKTLMLGKTGWKEKGAAEDEMVGWHHQIDGQEFEQALGVGDGQGGLACCSPWGRKESDTTE